MAVECLTYWATDTSYLQFYHPWPLSGFIIREEETNQISISKMRQYRGARRATIHDMRYRRMQYIAASWSKPFPRVPVQCINYICEDRKNVDELGGDIGAMRYALMPPSFKNPDHHHLKKNVQHGDAFKGTKFRPGLKMSNSNPSCRSSALHLFVKWIPPLAYWHRSHSNMCVFHLVVRVWFLFHCWKANR
jgi:hypothetical protein